MDLSNAIGLGIAGNFAHHLEQAGEIKDFENVTTDEPNAPKGMFPFYLPGSDSFLGIYNIGTDTLNLPSYEANAQLEPEIALYVHIVYDEDKKIVDLDIKKFTTFNDCTIRKEGAKKISEKKSWGKNSKGIGNKWIDIDKFEDGGVMDNYHLASFALRDGKVYEYGVDAPLVGYSYFYTKLKNWMIDKMNNQKDFGPLEDIYQHIKDCGYPTEAVITIGATAYAEFGEKNYLKNGDEIFVIAYHKDKDTSTFEPSDTKIILHQKVI